MSNVDEAVSEDSVSCFAVDASVDADAIDAALTAAAQALTAGGTVLVPTDTVYGLAALPTVEGATDQLFALKGRSPDQPIAVLVADLEQALSLVDLDELSEPDAALVRLVAERAWPGALTLVLPRHESARHLELGGSADNIGVRCPASPTARELAARVGAYATTSANHSGTPTPRDAAAATAALGRVDVVLDAGPCSEPASTVVSVSADGWIVLRMGALDPATVGAPFPLAPSGAGNVSPEAGRVADAIDHLVQLAAQESGAKVPADGSSAAGSRSPGQVQP